MVWKENYKLQAAIIIVGAIVVGLVVTWLLSSDAGMVGQDVTLPADTVPDQQD